MIGSMKKISKSFGILKGSGTGKQPTRLKMDENGVLALLLCECNKILTTSMHNKPLHSGDGSADSYSLM